MVAAFRAMRCHEMTMRAATVAFCLAILPGLWLRAEEGTLRYVKTFGSTTRIVEYSVTRTAEGVDVSSSGSEPSDDTHWIPGRGTVTWHEVDAAMGTDLRAERTGDTIRVRGKLKGRQVVKEVRVDAAPWYQIFGPAIGDLVPPGSSRTEFWVLSPDDLVAHKMVAARAGVERIDINGKKVNAVRVHFSPAGIFSGLWGADFWYRPSDSAWIYSRLPENGGVTITTLADQC